MTIVWNIIGNMSPNKVTKDQQVYMILENQPSLKEIHPKIFRRKCFIFLFKSIILAAFDIGCAAKEFDQR